MSDLGAEFEAIPALRDSSISLMATRYFMVITVTLMLYDHLLTFRHELGHIWGARNWLNKLIFLTNRYIVEATLVGTTYVMLELRPELSDKICRVSLIPIGFLAVICTAASHVMITLRLNALWDNNKTITYTMLGGFVVTYSIVLAFFIISVIDLHKTVFFFPSVNSCFVTRSPRMANGIWIAMVSFDALVLGLILANAVNRRRCETSETVPDLNKDGIMFFVLILTIRGFNMIFSLKTGGSDTFPIIYFMWAIFAIALCRLVIRIEVTNSQAAYLPGVQVWRPSTEGFRLVKVTNDHLPRGSPQPCNLIASSPRV